MTPDTPLPVAILFPMEFEAEPTWKKLGNRSRTETGMETIRGSWGNLPVVSARIGMGHPGLEKKIEKSVPSGDLIRVHLVTIETDEPALAVLEFYKHSLPRVRIADLGGYWSVEHVPESWTLPDRIEVRIPKPPESAGTAYEVVQYRKKGRRWR